MEKQTEQALNLIGVALSDLGLAVQFHLDTKPRQAQMKMFEYALTVNKLNALLMETVGAKNDGS